MSRIAKIASQSLPQKAPFNKRVVKNLTERQHPASRLAGHQCLKNSLKLKPLKLRMKPWLTVAGQHRWLDFAKVHKNCTTLDWSRVCFSDEAPFELFKVPSQGTRRTGTTKFYTKY